MRLNLDTTLTSPALPSIRLVPYTADHVFQYHTWMEDEDLRAATGSERLSAAQEAAMQAAWAQDGDKLTFIILDACALADAERAGVPRRQAELAAMVGDVNLFMQAASSDGEDGGAPITPLAMGEVEIMVAAPAARGKGMGAAAVRLLLTYARAHLGLARVVAKVGRTNMTSLALFTSRLGFVVVKEVAVFDEVHLRADFPDLDVGAGSAEVHPALVGVVEEGAYGAWLDGEEDA
jgi:RimJ/RimL family protein N-acetyltransferase